MKQVIVERFKRNRTADLCVTFLPILFAFGLRGVLQTTDIQVWLFNLVQIVLAALLIVFFVWSYLNYYRSFRYTLVDTESVFGGYPSGSLTFERLINKKSRIYERIMYQEARYLAAPGAAVPEQWAASKKNTYNLTVKRTSSAWRLYYAGFHPNQEQIATLDTWVNRSCLNS